MLRGARNSFRDGRRPAGRLASCQQPANVDLSHFRQREPDARAPEKTVGWALSAKFNIAEGYVMMTVADVIKDYGADLDYKAVKEEGGKEWADHWVEDRS
jgi:hypothetical protein